MNEFEKKLVDNRDWYFKPLEYYHSMQNLQILPYTNKISKLANSIFSTAFLVVCSPGFFVYSSILVLAFQNKSINANSQMWSDIKLSDDDLNNIHLTYSKSKITDNVFNALQANSIKTSYVTTNEASINRTVTIEFNLSITSFFNKVIHLMFDTKKLDLSKMQLLLVNKLDANTIETFRKISSIYSKIEITYLKEGKFTKSLLYL
jgi:hypothetical protein